MARLKLLIDTDIIIDVLKGVRSANELFRLQEIDICCSILSKKELLSKKGLSGAERKRIENLLTQVKVFRVRVSKFGNFLCPLLDVHGLQFTVAGELHKKLPRHARQPVTVNRKQFLRGPKTGEKIQPQNSIFGRPSLG